MSDDSSPVRSDALVAVTSRSFSRHPTLRAELLERYPNARFNDEGVELRGDALVAFLAGTEKAITALEPIDDDLLSRVPTLRVISKVGVGVDMIDMDALRRHGVRLGWAQGTNARSVAELVVALALSALRRIPQQAAAVRAGVWQQQKGRLLSGRTVGIVGFGAVGGALASLLRGFECELLVYDVRPVDPARDDVSVVELDELLERSEIVSLHAALTASSHQLIGRAALQRMRPDAILVNTARGALIDEDALAEALSDGRIGAACLDVFTVEPPVGSRLLMLDNVVVTPHIGGSTEEAIVAMGRAAIAGLDSAKDAAAQETPR